MPRGLLKAKGNHLEIRYTNVWANRLVGDEQLCDDWTYAAEDWWLEMTNAMPQRGCKLMGETYAQMRERMARERKRHPEVKQFVREYDERGKEIGWHWEGDAK